MSDQFDLFGNSYEEEPAKTTKLGTEPRIQYFDLETQKSADEVGGWGNIHKMGLAIGVVWDSVDQDYFVYEEKDAKKLVEKLQTADLVRSEEHTSELQSLVNLVCRLLLEKKKHNATTRPVPVV